MIDWKKSIISKKALDLRIGGFFICSPNGITDMKIKTILFA